MQSDFRWKTKSRLLKGVRPQAGCSWCVHSSPGNAAWRAGLSGKCRCTPIFQLTVWAKISPAYVIQKRAEPSRGASRIKNKSARRHVCGQPFQQSLLRRGVEIVQEIEDRDIAAKSFRAARGYILFP